MKQKPIGIIMNGVTGRMGTNQHLVRSIVAIRNQGGIPLPDGASLMPDPVLVGRSEDKLNALATANGITRWTTNLTAALADPQNTVYFDAQTTQRRVADVTRAILAGKHVYCEKPVSETVDEALELARLANEKGVKHGVVQDKLFLPGILKLKRLIASGFFGRILSVRGEFGYWVFEGNLQTAQRPSWNYRREDGGGMTVDMLCHWRYVLDHVFGAVQRVNCLDVTHIPERWDESGKPYKCTADDAAYATLQLENGIVAQFNSSWAVRVNRDELFEMQVDGTEGSAVAGLRNCRSQHRVNTPRPVWNPDVPNPIDFRKQWEEVPDNGTFDNAFKIQWEMFLKHVELGTPWIHDLMEGAKGVQLAGLALESSRTGRWLDVPALQIPAKKAS
jgi:predicted dehydrogenase